VGGTGNAVCCKLRAGHPGRPMTANPLWLVNLSVVVSAAVIVAYMGYDAAWLQVDLPG
jgi:hypothetical protein